MTSSPSVFIALPDLALVEFSGPDAAQFLQGQLTHDVATLPADRARLNGYCTPKGRLLASLVLWRSPEPADQGRFLGLIKQDIAEATIKRLGMYVLRSKVVVKRLDLPLHGLIIPSSAPSGVWAEYELPSDPQPWQIHFGAKHTAIAAPSVDGFSRWWLVGSRERENADDAPVSLWQAHDIAAGLPWIVADTQDTFIPQTVNLELIDGVSFTKGCYPGQEVVARSHYRGTVKRRMAYGVISEAPDGQQSFTAGQDTYDALKPDNPSGRLINAAKAAPDLWISGGADEVHHVLMETQLSDLAAADFRVDSGDGPAIKVQPLPYSIQPAG